MHYVSPNWEVELGQPIFKTQKQLGSRALVTDSFDKAMMRGTVSTAGRPGTDFTTPGPGQYAHRNGYNVLYGDWSAKWYGDPQEKILWWSESPAQMTGAEGAYEHGFACNVVSDLDTINYPRALTKKYQGGVYAWHMFDVFNGVDVGVDE